MLASRDAFLDLMTSPAQGLSDSVIEFQLSNCILSAEDTARLTATLKGPTGRVPFPRSLEWVECLKRLRGRERTRH